MTFVEYVVVITHVFFGLFTTFVEYVVVITHVFFGLFTIFFVLMRSFFVAHMALLDRLAVRGHHIVH